MKPIKSFFKPTFVEERRDLMVLTDEKSQEKRYTINSIEKALDVLEALSDYSSLSLIELADLLDKPKSSLYRIILTLENRGFISRSEEDGKYCLGYKPLIITKNLLENNSLRSCAVNEMKELVEKHGDTVNLGVLSHGSVLYLEIIEGTYSLRMNESVGSTAPFHASAIGKTIAAYLTEDELNEVLKNQEFIKKAPNTITDKKSFIEALKTIKNQGYAVDDEEVVQGARCIAAPIFNISGKVEAAVSISGAIHRYPLEKIPYIAQDVISVAQRISRKRGYVKSV